MRIFSAGAAGVLALAAAATLAPIATATAAPTPFSVGIPTVVDPIRGAGEPFIGVDNNGEALITAPAGTSTQTSWFWRSADHGGTYPLLGPSQGHWLCPSGGGDSSVMVDHVNGDIYLIDQEGLVSLGMAKLAGGDPSKMQAKCVDTPAMSADRPFQTIIHPTGAVKAPQYLANNNQPLVYLSWLCDACGIGAGSVGGIAFAWSSDGVTWHGADPGVPFDNLVGNQLYEAGTVSGSWHGTMVSDQQTGYVYTAISNGGSKPDFEVAVGKPGANRTDPSNIGQFASLTMQRVADSYNGKPFETGGNLFPVITQDAAGTIYDAWVLGDGTENGGPSIKPTEWHIYYSYSKDKPDHKVWSAPVRIDAGPQTATSVMPWVQAGDAGKLAVTWLGTDKRQSPNTMDPTMQWHPFMAVTTDADTPHPHFEQQRIGVGPSHIGDICLQGTICGASVPAGSRNMADFISIDILPNGAAQAVWADDANQVKTSPTTLVRGVPIVETARQVTGPRLKGQGSLGDFTSSAAPLSAVTGAAARTDAVGDAVDAQTDLTGARIEWVGGNLVVHVPAKSLSSLASPAGPLQSNLWWLVTWQYNGKIYFAKAESDSGGAPKYIAGTPASYDRPGLAYYTVPTLLDYRNGTTVTGKQVGNDFVITVPRSVVGGPKNGDFLEAVSAFSVADNGAPPIIAPVQSNVPTVLDAVPAFNAVLGEVTNVATNPVTVAVGASGSAPRVLGTQSSHLPATGGHAPVGIALGVLSAAAGVHALRSRRPRRASVSRAS